MRLALQAFPHVRIWTRDLDPPTTATVVAQGSVRAFVVDLATGDRSLKDLEDDAHVLCIERPTG